MENEVLNKVITQTNSLASYPEYYTIVTASFAIFFSVVGVLGMYYLISLLLLVANVIIENTKTGCKIRISMKM